MTSDSLVINASRTKTGGLILPGMIFVALGVWLTTLDPAEIESLRRYNNPTFVHGLGYATVAFFIASSICGYY